MQKRRIERQTIGWAQSQWSGAADTFTARFCGARGKTKQSKAKEKMASSLPPPTPGGLPPDVGSLLDSIGSGGSGSIGAGSGPATALTAVAATAGGGGIGGSTSGAVPPSGSATAAGGNEDGGGGEHPQQQQQQPEFDPIDFLNSNYQTEASLVSALPTLRSTINQRIEHLDESISSTIQKQADLADITATDVARARAAILRLQSRVETVQSKARLSEQAVLEITRDLKRLDFAKRHLSRTITALKRLHMLLHAVDRLHAAAYGGDPFPDYGTCANLIDATRLLLGHFDGYMGSIQKMRDVRDAVGTVRLDLREGAVFGFRVVGFGFSRALAKCGGEVPRCGGGKPKRDTSAEGGDGGDASKEQEEGEEEEEEEEYDRYANTGYVQSADDAYGAGLSAGSNKKLGPAEVPPPPMPKELLSEACMVIDALGLPTRREFVGTFCKDHLESYSETFDPKKNSSSGGGGGSGGTGSMSAGGLASASAAKSFKIAMPSTSGHGGGDSGAGGSDGGKGANPNPASLDQIDRRYAYYRRSLRELDDKFRDVFPQNWNVYHDMTYRFLQITSDHLSSLLTPLRPYRDRDCDDVTILLKALQKTVMFEKEMTAWLQRECGTIFLDGSREAEQAAREAEEAAEIEMDDEKAAIAAAAAAAGTGGSSAPPAVYGEDGEELEFDESGKAVAASSAEGIRIKYERKMREKREGRERGGAAELGVGGARHNRPIPAKPLIGVASATFDGFMGPYIALEEQNMDEQLVEFTSQREVDTRGELPVFTSSTALFVYIKNSITRCTNLTKGQTFFQLFASFQDTLKKYANVLEGMFPKPNVAVAAASAAINLSANIGIGSALANPSAVAASANSSSSSGAQSYRIPPGEEVTICHVIDTCEYCADTMEALEDLIRDKIDDKYKDKIDMSGEQEAFHDVTAKGIRVLVSGLESRADKPFRDMASIKWADMDVVGEESPYVRAMHEAICPFVITVRGLLPTSYFRNFCDKFAAAFTTTFYNSLIRQKRISESGSQQLLLDVTTLKTLLLKLPVLEEKAGKKAGAAGVGKPKQGTKIAPAMYTKMVTKQFQRIEILLKLVGTPSELLIDMFKSQWEGGSALDFQVIMNLKGMKRNEQAIYLEKLGVDPAIAKTGAAHGATSNITDHVQALQGRGSDVANKMTSDMANMRAKVESFRLQFR